MVLTKLNTIIGSFVLIAGLFIGTTAFAQEEVKMKHYLMIGEPTTAIWDALVQSGGKDIAKPGREATEALGGKIIGYYIGATEAKNYIIVAYPESIDMSKIVYMRAAQGVMDKLEFIEIIPADDVHLVFDSLKKKE